MEENKELTVDELEEISGGSIEDDEADLAIKDIEEAIRFIETEYAGDAYFQALTARLVTAITWIKAKQYQVALVLLNNITTDEEFNKKDTSGYIWNLLDDAQCYL